MSASTLAILANNAVTTWDFANQSTEPFTFYPQDSLPLADIAWNHNGQVIASCSAVSTGETEHNSIALSIASLGHQVDSFQHNAQWQREPAATTSLDFGGKSRYLCIGDKSGAVCLWDLKKKVRVRQFFHDGQASIQVSIDPTDTFVLSLTSESLHSYKLREGIPAMTWTPRSNYLFTCYKSSTLEPHIAAVGSDDGSLLLYDIANLQKSVPFLSLNRRHSSPITGIAFSPTNDKLMAATSSDGTLKFFDKLSGSLIEQHASVKSGITSMTMNSDGFSCAVGTEGGEVILYDLRQGGSPLASMYVEGPVTTVKFAPAPRAKTRTTEGTSGRKSQERNLLSSSRRDNLHSSSTMNSSLKDQDGLSYPPQATYTPGRSYENSGQSSSGSPSKSIALHTVSTAGGIGSLKPMSPPHASPARQGPSEYSGPPRSHQVESQTRYTPQKEPQAQQTLSLTSADIREVVRDEVEKLQDDLEDSIRNLHTDMIRQFHQQAQELSNTLSSQLTMMDQLREENQRLREENDFLKRSQMQRNGTGGQHEGLFGN